MLKNKPFIFFVFLFLLACDSQDEPNTALISQNNSSENTSQHFLKDVVVSGIDFKHHTHMQGNYWPHEILGAGAGVFDVDSDGDLDVYFRQGSSENDGLYTDRLYLNQWHETKQLKFKNSSEEFDTKNHGYGMGVTFGDIDNDGDLDVFLSNFGVDVMLENKSGNFMVIKGPWQINQWSTSATFVDINKDGWLDLYVGKYNQFKIGQDIACFNSKSQVDYCSPKSYPLEADSLYLNQQGTFVDISEAAGISSEKGYTLGVMVEDFNHDGWPDILTANDATKNFLWINQQDDRFINEGLKRGIAVNGKGEMEASMGIGMTDLDHDLDWDFIMTHLETESNTLYINDGNSYFMDHSNKTNMVRLSKNYTAFGVGWLDVNNDQYDDLIVINGAVNTIPEQRQKNEPNPLKQQQQILLNHPSSRFYELNDDSFSFINKPVVGRSAVFADFDNDGDKDILVTVNNGVPMLIENTSPAEHWAGFDLINQYGAQALGSGMLVTFTDGSQEIKRYHNDGSYLSGNDPRIIVKWKGDKEIKEIKVTWAQGQITTHQEILKNQYQQVSNHGS